jgi:hypothetical protein
VEASRTLPGHAAQVTVLREDWELINALSGPRTITELAGKLGRGAYSTARVVDRLHRAGLVQVAAATTEAEVVPLRRSADAASELRAPGIGVEPDPLLAMGLPHRTGHSTLDPPTDPLTAQIDDAIADALADAGQTPTASRPTLNAVADLDHDVDHHAPGPGFFDGEPAPVMDGLGAGHETGPFVTGPDLDPDLDDDIWDHSRLVADGSALHHEDLVPTSLDAPRPSDPNAAWLADLYSQFIDEPEAQAAAGKKRRRGDPNPVDVAFKSAEQDGEARVSTLERLMRALRKL